MTVHNDQQSFYQQETERKRNAYRISLITTILMGTIAILSAVITVVLKEYSFYGAISTGALSLLSLGGWLLIRRERAYAGITVLCTGIMLAGISLMFLARTPIVGLAVFIMVSGISSYTLPPRWSGILTTVGFLTGAGIVLLSIFGPSLDVYTNQNVTNIAVGILSIFYLLFLIRRYPSFSVRTKLAIFALVVVIIPLTALTILNSARQTSALQVNLEAQLVGIASQAANNLDNFILERRNAILGEAQIPDIISYLEMPPQERANSIQEEKTAKILDTYRTKDTAYTLSYAILDTKGLVLLDTNAENIGRSEADFSYFLPPMVNGFPYTSAIEFIGEAQQAQFTVSAPVFNASGKIIGILRVRYNASLFQDRLAGALESQPLNLRGKILDVRHLIQIADTGDPTAITKTLMPLDEGSIALLQQNRRLPSDIPVQNLQAYEPQLTNGLLNSDITPVFQAQSEEPGGDLDYIGTARMKNANWVIAIHEPASLIVEQVREQNNASTILAMIATGVALLAALGVSDAFTRPIRQLTNTALQIAGGNLNAQARVNSQDEFGLLANTFNATANQLRETLEGLEQRVAERTLELEQTSAESQKRAEQLQVISEVTRIVASEQDLETLLPLVTELVSERFGFYHTGIFLIDENNTFARLRAANSEGGKQMLERGHRLRVGQEGIVGFVTNTGQTRIALDVGEDAVFFNNPDLPMTRSEMALPLITRGRIIGALDVQSILPNAFTPADASTLKILADQVAVAIENARLYSETRQALAEIETLTKQYVAEKWQSVVRTRPVVGFHLKSTEIKPLAIPVEREEIKQAVTSGNVAFATPEEKSGDNCPALAVPIVVRGETVGVLDVQSIEPDRRWSRNEVALLKAVAERVGTALETARLFEDAQRQANKERIIGDISAKIGATIDFQNILHTAVEELGRVIPGSDVLIQLKSDEHDDIEQNSIPDKNPVPSEEERNG